MSHCAPLVLRKRKRTESYSRKGHRSKKTCFDFTTLKISNKERLANISVDLRFLEHIGYKNLRTHSQ